MGMYTQCRGWLNVNSIGDGYNKKLNERLEIAKQEFIKQHEKDIYSSWVCKDTFFHTGGNGSAFIFFGTELKNYNHSAEEWIIFILSYFRSAEGCIFFQYEEDEGENTIRVIGKGKIIDKRRQVLPFEGYGNMYKPDKQFDA